MSLYLTLYFSHSIFTLFSPPFSDNELIIWILLCVLWLLNKIVYVGFTNKFYTHIPCVHNQLLLSYIKGQFLSEIFS